ncbi:PREDICTED: placenta-expressed transcript 1 protein [Chrysochloris asiatica]|uniref:Placenta-expressed transcript 1 protein n=1 Tax=Chrysochloris asiatica TaxID=185453 RepID=A0A9B0WHQ1_CHRAS|nr:PREDICTED: placenta-expressed transcript 1 protein [Chrysochloris asiatica]
MCDLIQKVPALKDINKSVSCQSSQFQVQEFSKQINTMKVLSSTLLPRRLFLCLALLVSSAISASTYDNSCVVFYEFYTINDPAITVSPKSYESNTHYKDNLENTKKALGKKLKIICNPTTTKLPQLAVNVPVQYNTTYVYLRAIDKFSNLVGTWQSTSQEVHKCKGLYNVENFNDTFFEANWLSPNSSDLNEVAIQVITVYNNQNATYSALRLTTGARPTTADLTTARPTTADLPTARPTTADLNTARPTTTSQTTTSLATTSQTTISLTTTRHTTARQTSDRQTTARHLTTNTSLANKIYSNPITSAIHILLVFLISRIIF